MGWVSHRFMAGRLQGGRAWYWCLGGRWKSEAGARKAMGWLDPKQRHSEKWGMWDRLRSARDGGIERSSRGCVLCFRGCVRIFGGTRLFVERRWRWDEKAGIQSWWLSLKIQGSASLVDDVGVQISGDRPCNVLRLGGLGDVVFFGLCLEEDLVFPY